MVKVSKILFPGISILLILSISPIVFGEAFAGGSPTSPLSIGDYMCWRIVEPSLIFSTQQRVEVTDQFGTEPHNEFGALEFCESSDKTTNTDFFPSPFNEQHYTGYRIVGQNPTEVVDIRIHNFPNFDLTNIPVGPTEELLVPNIKFRTTTPESSNNPELHYKCYDIFNDQISLDETIRLSNQFGDFEVIVTNPLYICNPATKIHGSAQFGNYELDEHLTCFDIEFRNGPNISINRIFDQIIGDSGNPPLSLQPTLLVPDKVCFESTKTLSSQNDQVIGGTIIPIESSSLLLAGLETNYSILTAFVVLGSVAFGVLYYTTKKVVFNLD